MPDEDKVTPGQDDPPEPLTDIGPYEDMDVLSTPDHGERPCGKPGCRLC